MNRKVIITGAGRGIGRAIALAFAKEKDHLILTCHRNTAALNQVKEEAEALGASVTTFLGDLSDPSVCASLTELISSVFGAPDILINNASVSHVSLIQDSSDEDYLNIIHTNLSSVVRLSKSVVKLMIPKKCGRIVNISSVYGETGASTEAEYAAAKGAVNTFTRSLAKELAPSGIAVNAVAPGAVDTEMNSHLTPEDREFLEEEIPFGRMASPEEIAEVVRLLCDAPLYLTGDIIRVDGAWT